MDPLASISRAAAGVVATSLAQVGAAAGAAGQDPGPGTAAALAQSGTAADVSVAVLKKLLNLDAADGAQLAQLIAGQVDLQA